MAPGLSAFSLPCSVPYLSGSIHGPAPDHLITKACGLLLHRTEGPASTDFLSHMRIIGLTGGIACGKSTVSRLLREQHGVPFVDADAISHQVLAPGGLAHRRVVAAFGTSILDTKGAIDRKRLGALVFDNRALRRRLERIQMPHIALSLAWALFRHFLAGTAVVVLDAALLFETGLHRICSTVLAVHASDETQLARLLVRDRAGEEDARRRIAAQPMSPEVKAHRACVSLPNNTDRAALAEALDRVAPTLLRCSVGQRLARGPPLLLLAAATYVVLAGIGGVGGAGGTGGGVPPPWLLPLLTNTGLACALAAVALLVAFPADRAVASGGAYMVLLVSACCVLLPALLLRLLAAALLAVAVHALAQPKVLRASIGGGGGGGGGAVATEASDVLFAGSFNPLHEGHLDILRELCRAHPPPSTVFACIGFNPKKTYAVDVEARQAMLVAACAADEELAGRVQVRVVEQYPWRFALRHGVRFLYRGVRTWAQDGMAETLLAALNLVGPLLLEGTLPPTTRYVEATPHLAHISSTLVRKRAAEGGSLEGLVPAAVVAEVARAYSV